jgi:hypothetical protein
MAEASDNMPSLLFPDEPQPPPSLLGMPPAGDDQSNALAQLYRRITDNPVGTEQLRPTIATNQRGPFDPVIGEWPTGLPMTQGQHDAVRDASLDLFGQLSNAVGLPAAGEARAVTAASRRVGGGPRPPMPEPSAAPQSGVSLEEIAGRRHWAQPNLKSYSIQDPTGRHLGTIDTNWDPMLGDLRVENVQSVGGPNSMGPASIKQLRAALLEQYPEAQILSGERITGAGPGGGEGAGRETFQRVKPYQGREE